MSKTTAAQEDTRITPEKHVYFDDWNKTSLRLGKLARVLGWGSPTKGDGAFSSGQAIQFQRVTVILPSDGSKPFYLGNIEMDGPAVKVNTLLAKGLIDQQTADAINAEVELAKAARITRRKQTEKARENFSSAEGRLRQALAEVDQADRLVHKLSRDRKKPITEVDVARKAYFKAQDKEKRARRHRDRLSELRMVGRISLPL